MGISMVGKSQELLHGESRIVPIFFVDRLKQPAREMIFFMSVA
jgi:hypothetical protein